ncbi:MAG: tocopherol cyclase family protein [Erysipelotrichaceae bacterium]
MRTTKRRRELVQTSFLQPNRFEGYYFKHTNAKQGRAISFIVGFSTFQADPHAFIQVLQVPGSTTHYLRFQLSECKVQNEPFQLSIANNHFSFDGCLLDLKDETITIKGSLQYRGFTPLPKRYGTQSIMGPFDYLPGMQCMHGIVSMQHQVHGSLWINNNFYDYANSNGYIEKDWGSSFPKHYVWIHANDFSKPVSFFFSLAHIPYLRKSFDGFICNFYINGEHLRFATYNHATLTILNIQEDQISFEVSKAAHRIVVVAKSKEKGVLLAPKEGAMIEAIKEGLQGEVHLCYYHQDALIFEETSTLAGIELVHATAFNKHRSTHNHKH